MASIIERQIEDWQKRGVINSDIADTLRADTLGNGAKPAWAKQENKPKSARRFSFFQVLIVFAAISFAAGVALLIASNWETIPRLARAGGVLAIIAIALLGGVFVRGRFGAKSRYAEEACYLIAGGAFISAVALVAQMYHISGDERDAALLYAAGLGFAAFAVRSLVLTGGALFFWASWHLDGPFASDWLSWQFWAYFVAVAATYFLARNFGSIWAQRMALLAAAAGLLDTVASIASWILSRVEDGLEWFFDLPDGVRATVWGLILVASIGALLLAKRKPPAASQNIDWRVGAGFGAGCLALLGLHEFADDDFRSFALAGGVIGFVLLTLFLHGQRHRLTRYICYAVFLIEIFYLYAETISSMVSTSGFLMLLAAFLVVVATIIYQLEKRFKRKPKQEEAV